MNPIRPRAWRASWLLLLVLMLSSWLTACGGDDDANPAPVTPPAATGTVGGCAVSASTGLPLAGVSVSIGAASATTDGDGRYTLAGATHADRAVLSTSSSAISPAARRWR